MSINKEDTYQHALCIDLTSHQLQYAFLNKKTKNITAINRIDLSEYNREGVEPFLTNEVLKYEFDTLSVSAGSARNTLIPFDLFNHSKVEDIFALNFPRPFDGVDYNRIPELGMVNIYEFPVWIKSTFVPKFPRIKLIHRSSVFLRGIFDQSTFEGKIHLLIEDSQFYLAVTIKSKLQYFNRFDMLAFSDLAYHLNFVIDQKQLEVEEYELNLYGIEKS